MVASVALGGPTEATTVWWPGGVRRRGVERVGRPGVHAWGGAPGGGHGVGGWGGRVSRVWVGRRVGYTWWGAWGGRVGMAG